jgi:hypothetical protein
MKIHIADWYLTTNAFIHIHKTQLRTYPHIINLLRRWSDTKILPQLLQKYKCQDSVRSQTYKSGDVTLWNHELLVKYKTIHFTSYDIVVMATAVFSKFWAQISVQWLDTLKQRFVSSFSLTRHMLRSYLNTSHNCFFPDAPQFIIHSHMPPYLYIINVMENISLN